MCVYLKVGLGHIKPPTTKLTSKPSTTHRSLDDHFLSCGYKFYLLWFTALERLKLMLYFNTVQMNIIHFIDAC